MILYLQIIIIDLILINNIWNILIQNYNYTTNIMIFLITIIMNIIILMISNKDKIMTEIILLLTFILIIAFNTFNIIIFFITFETVLIPMLYLISKNKANKIAKFRTIFRFTIYTITGGLIFLLFIIFNINHIQNITYYALIENQFKPQIQLILFPITIITFFIKLPIIPFHSWLPDTHGEAPTIASIILAAILLKLGAIGIIRWLIPILPYAFQFYKPIILILGIISTIYATINTLRQIDMKKLIAYSSIAHIAFVLIAINNHFIIKQKEVIFLLYSHGLVSALLFFLIGILYIRTNTRYIIYYKALNNTMPIFSTLFFVALLLNTALPPSLPFLTEYLILQTNIFTEFLGTIHIIIVILLTGVYSITLFTKIAFSYNFTPKKYNDIQYKEFILSITLILLTLIYNIHYF